MRKDVSVEESQFLFDLHHYIVARVKAGVQYTSVVTNNSLFEYSNNRRPNNDIRIRIWSFLKY